MVILHALFITIANTADISRSKNIGKIVLSEEIFDTCVLHACQRLSNNIIYHGTDIIRVLEIVVMIRSMVILLWEGKSIKRKNGTVLVKGDEVSATRTLALSAKLMFLPLF